MSTYQRLSTLLTIMNSAGWSRDDAHALLEAALDIADYPTDAEEEAGRLTQAAALTLSRAIAVWMVAGERTPAEWDHVAATDPATWREEVIERMRLTPALLPQPAVEALMFALIDLNNGQQPAIFQPAARGGYGKNPTSRRALEQAMLVWIEIEKARGRPARKVQEEVAAAVGRSHAPRATEEWLREWRKRDGEDHVNAVLRAAGALARSKEASLPPSDELLLLQFTASADGGSLRSLAESWKAAGI